MKLINFSPLPYNDRCTMLDDSLKVTLYLNRKISNQKEVQGHIESFILVNQGCLQILVQNII